MTALLGVGGRVGVGESRSSNDDSGGGSCATGPALAHPATSATAAHRPPTTTLPLITAIRCRELTPAAAALGREQRQRARPPQVTLRPGLIHHGREQALEFLKREGFGDVRRCTSGEPTQRILGPATCGQH